MKAKKIITLSLTAALVIGALTANGVIVSADAEKGTIKVAASATPHAEILEEAKPLLEAEGWDLEVTVFDDYVQPNLVVESGDFDANYFQHIPYLDNVIALHIFEQMTFLSENQILPVQAKPRENKT